MPTTRCTHRLRAPESKTSTFGVVIELGRRPRCKRFTKRPSGLCEYHERVSKPSGKT